MERELAVSNGPYNRKQRYGRSEWGASVDRVSSEAKDVAVSVKEE